MTAELEPALSCENLTRYLGVDEARTCALNGVSLSAYPGYTHAIVGPSGCGKSTLLYLLGLLDRPDDGEIWIGGEQASTLSDGQATRFRNQNIGFVFQFHFLLFQFSVLENLMLPLVKSGRFSESEMEERAYALLKSVGLDGKAHRRANHLSGGEQQRVAIARALAGRPRLLLADEPTGNLDSVNSVRAMELLEHAVREENLSLVLVTHNPEIAERCDIIFEMADGQVVTTRQGQETHTRLI